MSIILPANAFPSTAVSLYNNIMGGTPLIQTPASVANGIACAAGVGGLVSLISGHNFTGTDYNSSSLATLQSSQTNLAAQQTSLTTHVSYQQSNFSLILARANSAGSISASAAGSSGSVCNLVNQAFGIISGGLDTVFNGINAAIAAVTSVIGAGLSVVNSLIQTVISDIANTVTSIATAIANELGFDTANTGIIQAFASAMNFISMSIEPCASALLQTVGTATLLNHL